MLKLGLLLLLGFFATAQAQERKAWRHVDDAGRITYSQTPPMDGRDATRISTAPALSGRGGYVGGPQAYWENPNYYARFAGSRLPASSYSATVGRGGENRIAALRAECARQRNVDCNNPATLQYLDSLSTPRRAPAYRYPRG